MEGQRVGENRDVGFGIWTSCFEKGLVGGTETSNVVDMVEHGVETGAVEGCVER
jgi:hypothetical protein